MSHKTEDPQITISNKLIKTSGGEMIVCSVRLGLFQLTCLNNIPDQGKNESFSYIKFRVINTDSVSEDKQITVQNFIKKSTKTDNELLICEVELGLFKLVFVNNLPDEDTDTALTYVKWKLVNDKEETE